MITYMNRFWSRNIIFIIITMFSGQILAATFLECRGDMMASWQNLDHATQNTPTENDTDTGHKNHQYHADQSSHAKHQHTHDKMEMNSSSCDCSCDVCFGVASIQSPQVTSPLFDNQNSLLNFQQVNLPLATLENPFRPPIIA